MRAGVRPGPGGRRAAVRGPPATSRSARRARGRRRARNRRRRRRARPARRVQAGRWVLPSGRTPSSVTARVVTDTAKRARERRELRVPREPTWRRARARAAGPAHRGGEVRWWRHPADGVHVNLSQLGGWSSGTVIPGVFKAIELNPRGFAWCPPLRRRSRGPRAPLRSGGRARGAPSPLCGSPATSTKSRLPRHNGLCTGICSQPDSPAADNRQPSRGV